MCRVIYLVVIMMIANICLYAQPKERLSRAYIGAQLHQNEAGFSLTNSFGVNKYLGIGAGVDLISYDGELLVPAYFDVRGRYAFDKWEPFIFGQVGKNLYKKNDAITYVDITGQGFKYDKNGKLFYGGGVGLAYKIGKVGVFAAYAYRRYQYKYSEAKASGAPNLPELPVNANIISVGLVF